MPAIRPEDLPAAGTVNNTAALIVDTGSNVVKATPQQVVDAGRPLASQAEAEAGANNAKMMTPLRVKQFLDAQPILTEPILAADDGSSLVGFQQSGTAARSRTVQSKARETLSLYDFDVVGDGVTDDIDAIEAAIVEAVSSQRELIIPDSVFGHSRTVDLSHPKLRVRGEGRAAFQALGDFSPCVKCDAGIDPETSEERISYQHTVRNLIIRGSGAPNQVGFFQKNYAHTIREEIRVRNVGKRGFEILGDVLSLWTHCLVSYTDEGGGDAVYPEVDFSVGGTEAISATAACLFINCMAEKASAIGWDLERVDNSAWVGGTSEGLDGRGMRIGALCNGNTFENVFMEANATGDVEIFGKDNRFLNCAMTSRAGSTVSIILKAGAVGNRFDGGFSYRVTVEPGALNTTFQHLLCYEVTDGGEHTYGYDRSTIFDDVQQTYLSSARYQSRNFGNINNPAPNQLDWYEETQLACPWGGAATNGTIMQSSAVFATRVGDRVTFDGQVTVTAVSAAPTGDLLLKTDLPAAKGPAIVQVAGTGLTYPAAKQLVGRFAAGSSNIGIYTLDAGTLTPLAGSALGNGTVSIAGAYKADGT